MIDNVFALAVAQRKHYHRLMTIASLVLVVLQSCEVHLLDRRFDDICMVRGCSELLCALSLPWSSFK